MQSSIYLTGGSPDPADLTGQSAAPDWRALALTKLQTHGLRVVNPLEMAWEGLESPSLDASGQHIDQAELILEMRANLDSQVRRALELIDQCDVVLANLSKSSYATAMQLFYAHRQGKMVTVAGQPPFSPWVLSHSQARFPDISKAVDYLIDEHPQFAPLNWTLQAEAMLAERYEKLPEAGEADHKFIGGQLPVAVLAPHATAFWREGEFQEAESFTGSLAGLLNRTSGCHVLRTDYCCVADPCWYLETPFRRAFGDVAKAGQIGLVVMVLGSSWREAPGLQISALGPGSGEYASRLKLKLSAIEPVAPDTWDNETRPLVQFAAEELKLPVIVVRLHKRYRMPRLQPELFLRISAVLSEFISEAGYELARSAA